MSGPPSRTTLRSPYPREAIMAAWTTADIPDQHGVIAVVTGSNSGIGFIAARELARAGATTVMACRNAEKAADAEAKIRADVPEADLTVLPLDLADLSSVRAFATDLGQRYDGLDLLVNNAGVMAIPHRTTKDGFERSEEHTSELQSRGNLVCRLLL